jgi:hypothetical protein
MRFTIMKDLQRGFIRPGDMHALLPCENSMNRGKDWRCERQARVDGARVAFQLTWRKRGGSPDSDLRDFEE